MATPDPAPPRPRRGIYLLPNLLTTGGLLAGYFAIVSAIGGRYEDAAIAVFVAGVLDGIDGRVARMTNTQSAFGVQYDSLADLVSFGLAPSLVMYAWALSSLQSLGPVWGKVGWAAAFLYAACAALRLARFNTQVGVVDKRWFLGLSSPAAAGLLMSYVWTLEDSAQDSTKLVFLSLGVTVAAALLMVSGIRYWSFKSRPVNERVPFLWMLIVVGLLVLLVIDPPRVLLAVTWLYALSGPVMWVLSRRRARARPAA
jgi:CDP-diacylglycerol--serine O-phosphatidyltransferase